MSSSSLSKGGSGGLMNKLISLSSEGKFSIVDSVMDKVSNGSLIKKVEQVLPTQQLAASGSKSDVTMKTSEEYDKVFSKHPGDGFPQTSSSRF
jgi:regulator of sigma D